MKLDRVLQPGDGSGRLLVLTEPLSLWGGVDGTTGEIVESSHPQAGESIAGTILVLPHGRGSSSSSYVLAELLRVGSGPAAIVLDKPDSILVVGSVVAERLYDAGCPIVLGTVSGRTGEVWQLVGSNMVRADPTES